MPRRSEPIRTASPYAYANAQEAVRRFLGRHRRIVIGAVLVLIVCAVPTVVRAPDIEGLAVYAVVCLGVSFASVVLSRRNVDGLLGILSADCCARKMLDATALLMGKRTRRRERPTWEVLYAMCSAQLGYDDIALQWADEAESSPGLSLSNRLLACNVRAVVAEHRDDRPRAGRRPCRPLLERARIGSAAQDRPFASRMDRLRPCPGGQGLATLQRASGGHGCPELHTPAAGGRGTSPRTARGGARRPLGRA